ncbi:MAG: hypothetical protein ACM30I_15745 [Gemmatimonas sp.]
MRDRRNGGAHAIPIRTADDYRTIARVYGDEAYSIDHLPRRDDLWATHDRIIAAGRTPLVLDCGADAGITTRYFAGAFPAARVIGVESDGDTFAHAATVCRAGNAELRRANIAAESAGSGIRSLNSLVAECSATGAWPFIVRIDLDRIDEDLFSANSEWVEEFPLIILELRRWLFPAAANTCNVLRRLADADRDFVFVGDALFSVSNYHAAAAAAESRTGLPNAPVTVADPVLRTSPSF